MNQNRSTNKILVFVIFLLLITNIAVVGYFLFFAKKKSYHNSKDKEWFAAVLKKEVGFNDKQVAQYIDLKKSHWNDAKMGMDEIIRLKNNIFDLTRQQGTSDSLVVKLADSIGTLQRNVEVNFYKHVLLTRKICTADQEPKYDTLMKRILNKGKNRKSDDRDSTRLR